MPVVLQIDLPHPGPWGAEMAAALQALAQSIAREPGLRWKIWTENATSGESGDIDLFDDRASAQAHLDMHSARLASFGVTAARARLFDVNPALSAIDRAPLEQAPAG